jgi:hypothetical protein
VSNIRPTLNSNEHVAIHFETFDGYALFGGIDHIRSTDLRDYLKDEVSGWMDDLWKPKYDEKAPDCGVFLRESREHGFLWLPRPRFIRSFHSHAGVVYSLVKNARDEYHTWMHPMLHRVIRSGGDGFTEIPMERMDLLRAAAVPVAVCNTSVNAHRTTCDHISRLTDEVM